MQLKIESDFLDNFFIFLVRTVHTSQGIEWITYYLFNDSHLTPVSDNTDDVNDVR